MGFSALDGIQSSRRIPLNSKIVCSLCVAHTIEVRKGFGSSQGLYDTMSCVYVGIRLDITKTSPRAIQGRGLQNQFLYKGVQGESKSCIL